jgi:diguanylate cyclase (GGDEF)-like protein
MNPLRKLLPTALVALGLYLAGAWLSNAFMRSADDVALIWLPAGVGFAIAIIAGGWGFFVVALSVLLVHLLIAPVPPLFLLYSVAANTLGAAAAMLAFRLMGGSAVSRLTVRTGFVILIGGIALAACSATVGTLGLVHAAMVPAQEWPGAFLAWALGDVFGVIALTATLLLISTALRRRLGLKDAAVVPEPRRHPAEYVGWALSSLGVLGLVAWAGAASGSQALGLAGLPMAMLLWSAIRFPALLTFIATTVLALIVAMLTGLGIAGFTIPSGTIESAVLVAFLCISMVVPQVLAGAIHENRVAALRLLRRALRDPLTGLPNRAAFDEDLRRALAKPGGRPLLVAYLDLDQFKIINDTLSHAAGDALLRELAGLIRALLPADAELYRLGGDEFAVLQPCVPDAEAMRLLDSLRQRVADFRFAWEAGLISTQVSIGYALSERPDDDYGELLAQVDAACFTAKELGGNRVQHAAPGEQAVRERTSAMHWVLRINDALEHDRFELFCQAITPLGGEQDGRHLEILLRKREASTGRLLPPAEFIAAAERFGLSARLDTWVVDRTLSWLEDHPQSAASVRLCSINLSTASLVDASFARFLRQRLARSSFPLTRLCFEITETGAVRDLARAVEFIRGLRALGCRFALDDFGTGFCSFSYLPKLDVDLLKIDGSFVRDAGTSPLALAIVQAIVRIAQVTGRKTVAEWVETPDLVERMRELGLDYVQGYAFSRPQPIAEFFAAGRE